MSPIRPLERHDLKHVARLHADAAAIGPGSRFEERLPRFLERTLIDQPWADPEIPSLVYDEDGDIVGFLGSNVRLMRFDGKLVRMACSAHLVAHPRVRTKGIGGLLLRAYLAGPQDLTITDGATETVQQMWETLGGSTVHLSCLAFVVPLRPATLAMHTLLRRRAPSRVEAALKPIALVLDRPANAFVRASSGRSRSTAQAEPLTPDALLEHLPTVTRSLRLVPAYDVASIRWLFTELAAVGREAVFPDRVERGALSAELVRDGGRVIGWYICHLRRGGVCRVLQLAAAPGRADAILDRLEDHADAAGAAAIYGRLEPRLLQPLARRRCFIRFAPAQMLAHARDAEIVAAIRAGDALLTRMEGEWW